MSDTAQDSKKKYMIIIGILALVCVVLLVMQFSSHSEITTNNETIESLEVEQLELENELKDMLIQYDTVNVKNERLNAEILGQQEQIKEMLKQIEKHKDDAYIIHKLKKEAATLRDIMKGYLVTIDSLNTLNQDLMSDNEFLAEELSSAVSKAQDLESSKKELEEVVATGSILQADGMTSVGLRVRNNGKQSEVTKASKVELIKTCAKIGENRISKAGKKTIYLRIISPDGVVLESGDADSRFEFNGVSGKYSIKRVIDYKNEAMDLCIFYTMDEEAEKATGKYIVEMYESGMLIGKADFDLK